MPPRSTPPPRGSFYPSNDVDTYRDLLMFEERLKTNAANLQRRKHRYQLFLVQLLVIIGFLLCEVLLPPHISLLVIPYRMLLQRLLPDIYTPDTEVIPHPAFASGLLFVSLTTLVLFFVSGMYSEKIGYANKYVPHANRALRSFNMYLNVRKPPLRSKFYFTPLSFFFPHPPLTPSPDSRSSSQEALSPSRTSSPGRSTAVPISPIPPSSNPRGELIFSSRIDKNFRDSYERYRTAFERRREERERLLGMQKGPFGISWLKWNHRWMFWRKADDPADGPAGGHFGGSGGMGAITPARTASNASSRDQGSGSRSGTPLSNPGTLGQRERSFSRTGVSMRTKRSNSPSPPTYDGTNETLTGPSRHGIQRARKDSASLLNLEREK